jgi:hypothetical protein
MTSEQTRRRRVTVDVRLLPSRRSVPFLAPARMWWVWVALGCLPFIGAGGYVAGRLGADIVGQVATAVGATAVAALVLSAVISWRR